MKRSETYLAMMLPGSATLRVCFRGLVGRKLAVGFDVSRASAAGRVALVEEDP